MTAAILIPARMESKRLPGKPLVQVGGKPLVQWAWEAASAVSDYSAVVTDSREVEAWCRDFGARSCFVPDDLPTGSDRCAAAYHHGRLDAPEDWETIINLQCDEPDITSEDLEWLIADHRNRLDNVTTFAYEPVDSDEFFDRNNVKVVLNQERDALYFSREPLPGAMIHVGVYAYRPTYLLGRYALKPPGRLEQIECLEQLRVLELGNSGGMYRSDQIRVLNLGCPVRSINTPADVERFNAAVTV